MQQDPDQILDWLVGPPPDYVLEQLLTAHPLAGVVLQFGQFATSVQCRSARGCSCIQRTHMSTRHTVSWAWRACRGPVEAQAVAGEGIKEASMRQSTLYSHGAIRIINSLTCYALFLMASNWALFDKFFQCNYSGKYLKLSPTIACNNLAPKSGEHRSLSKHIT